MNEQEITLEQLKEAVQQIETIQETKDFQKLEKILPLVLKSFKRVILDDEQQSKGCKFYAPVWVDRLLNRLIEDKNSLSPEEHAYFKGEVEKLSLSDYKTAEDSMAGYKIQYASVKEISEVIVGLKCFFHLL